MTSRALLLLPALVIALAAPAAASTHVVGTPGDERIVGTDGRDWIQAHGGDDRVLGVAGNDLLDGGDGQDVVRGGPGNDELHGGRGGDLVSGGLGKDSLNGDRGRDDLRGGPGNDFLADYDDGDLLLGGAGNDRAAILSEDPSSRAVTRLHLGPGDDAVTVNDDHQPDIVDCGPGTDLAEWVTSLDPLDEYVGCEVVQEYLGY